MKPTPLKLAAAEAIALKALGFLAEDHSRFMRFLDLTGLGLDELRQHAGAPSTQLAVLDHLLADESLLLVFAASSGVAPDTIAPAHRLIAGAVTEE